MAELTAQQRAEIAEIVRQAVSTPAQMTGIGVGSVPQPDPTTRTNEAVDRATAWWDRQLAAAIEVLETRLAGMDTATRLNADRLAEIPRATAEDLEHIRADTAQAILSLRELLGERIDGMDKATKLLAENVALVRADIEGSANGLKEIVDTRLAGMDEATKLLATNVDKVPYAILQEAGNLKAFIMSRIDEVQHVADERFDKVAAQFEANDKALNAALNAQKDAAAEQQKSNTLAIDKSERTTQETIRANDAKTASSISAQAATIADLKDRLVRLEAGGLATTVERTEQRTDRAEQREVRQDTRGGTSLNLTAISVLIAALILAIGIYAAFHHP